MDINPGVFALMNRMRLNAVILIISVTVISLSILTTKGLTEPLNPSDSNNKSSSRNSTLTPFNFTTYLKWEPWMVEPPQFKRDFTMTNDSIFMKKGLKQPFYVTLLPMMPNVTEVNYTISIEQLDGPSNISISFIIELHAGEILLTKTSTLKMDSTVHLGDKILNTSQQRSATGSIVINQSIPESYSPDTCCSYSYDYVKWNMTTRYAYSLFVIQPYPENENDTWNHSLLLKISVSGWEDRAFFNQLMQAKGLPPWNSTHFAPLNNGDDCCSSNTNIQLDGNDTKMIRFGPMHGISPFEPMTKEILISAFPKFPRNESVMQLNLFLQTTEKVQVGMRFARHQVTSSLSSMTSTEVFTSAVPSGTNITVKFNWKFFDDVPSIITYPNPTEDPEFMFYTVEIILNSSLPSWRAWTNISITTSWHLDNASVPPNTTIVDVQEPSSSNEEQQPTETSSQENISNNDIITSPPTSRTTSPDVFPFLMLIFPAVLITRRKRQSARKKQNRPDNR